MRLGSDAAPRGAALESPRVADIADVTLRAAAVAAIMLVTKGTYTGSISITNALVLIPFFFCSVPVLGAIWLRELWQWNRVSFRFERFDAERRPTVARCLIAFWAIASVTFAGYFFFL